VEPLRPPLLRRLRPGHWIAADCAVTALAVPLSSLLSRRGAGGLRGIDVLVIVLAALAAGLRRRWPATVLAGAVLAGAVATGLTRQPAPWLAVAFMMYLVPLRLPGRQALWLLAGTLVLTAAGPAGLVPAPHGPSDSDSAGMRLVSLLVITIAWTIGQAVGQHRLYAAGVHAQEQQRAHEQLTEAHRAMGEQRLRIARELHDVVAHTMSVIAVQAGVANHVAAEHPDEARRALSSIEETSRGALREMRALLGVLRADEDHEATGQPGQGPTPAPQLADLDTLAERTARAGVRVDLVVEGERLDLSAGLQLAAYRIVQEALTNVVKHATTDHCQVNITHEPDALTISVTDNGQGADGRASGHGIAGMRERVDMYGGELHAGPRPSGGFCVTARFPLTTTATL
jgi:signal transduction histidine kinase